MTHVVRYARFIDILDDGTLNCSAFQLRKAEAGLSVNWLEYFEGQSKPQQLNEVRRLIRLTMKSSGRLAELEVGATRGHIGQRLDELRFNTLRYLQTKNMKPIHHTAKSWACLRRTPRKQI